MDISKIDKNFQSAAINKDDIKIYDVREEPFELYGFYMPESAEEFRRIPNEVAKNMSEGAFGLNVCTAGGRVRFKTDSKYIALKMTTSAPSVIYCAASCQFTIPPIPKIGKSEFCLN